VASPLNNVPVLTAVPPVEAVNQPAKIESLLVCEGTGKLESLPFMITPLAGLTDPPQALNVTVGIITEIY
jgi:hypothetical protein